MRGFGLPYQVVCLIKKLSKMTKRLILILGFVFIDKLLNLMSEQEILA